MDYQLSLMTLDNSQLWYVHWLLSKGPNNLTIVESPLLVPTEGTSAVWRELRHFACLHILPWGVGTGLGLDLFANLVESQKGEKILHYLVENYFCDCKGCIWFVDR